MIDLQKAYSEFEEKLMKLMVTSGIEGIKRDDYTKALNEVQDRYGLKQGHPQFLEWVFTCVGRSPIIVEEEGAGDHGKTEDK